MVSAGSAGTPSTIVSSAAGRAGVPFGETPPPAVPSDAASSLAAGADWPGCLLRACRGGAMKSLVRESWSSMRLSSEAREVTTVGELPPELSGLSVRLSKPTSL